MREDLKSKLRNRTALSRLNETECEKVFDLLDQLSYDASDAVSEVSGRLESLVNETADLIEAASKGKE